jgi:hypothetical protein
MAGGANCDATHGCFTLLPIPLSWVVEDVDADQFVGIEFNPTARTGGNTFRLGLLQRLQLSLHLLTSFLPDSGR